MGKRSNFLRNERDYYPTPYEAVVPLLQHLKEYTHFCEPCAGDGRLIDHLVKHGHVCEEAFDIYPQRKDILQRSALFMGHTTADYIITNPSWERSLLHQLIERFSDIKPSWLLFDADWMFTKQALPYLPRLRKVITIGRVKWVEGSKNTGKDNCCWYLFDKPKDDNEIVFYGKGFKSGN